MNDFFRRAFDFVRANRSAQIALLIAVSVNAILLVAYVWSRGGQTTVVRFDAQGEYYLLYVDGRAQTGNQLDAPPAGALLLTLDDTTELPSLPSPRGIDSIVVRDKAGGTVLFEDDFSSFPSDRWRVREGSVALDDGVLGAHGDATIELLGEQWSNASVEVRYRNVTSAGIVLRAREDGYGVVANVRPFHWNEDFSKWASISLGRPHTSGPGLDIQLDETESLKALTAMLLRPYPYIAILGVVALALVFGLQRLVPQGDLDSTASSLPRFKPWVGIALPAIVAFGIVLYLNVSTAEHVPYVPDAITYLFQARLLADGHLSAPPPPVEGVFDFFDSPPIVVRDGKWIGQYPIGHPLMLAIGLRVHALWLIPALIGAGSVAMIGLVARKVYGMRVGVLAAVLLATSPFFIMNATNLMSHNTAGFYILACLAALCYRDRRPVLFSALAGLCFGLFMNTRPLSSAALVAPFGILLLSGLIERERRRQRVIEIAAFGATAAAMLGVYMLCNLATTGDPLRSGYQASGVSFFADAQLIPAASDPGPLGAAVGAGGGHDYATGISNERIQMGLLLLVLNGWPQFVGMAFVLLPFILGTRKLFDWFLLTCAVSVMAIWTFYERAGVMYGPRYWYEALPFLLLLAARGVDRAAEMLSGAIHAMRRGFGAAEAGPMWAGRAVAYGFVSVLVLASVWGWLLGQRVSWRADFVPNRAAALCCVLGMDDRIPQLVEEQGISNALVLVEPCQSFVCYGSVFWRNEPTLDGDIVYARDIPPMRDALMAAYPDRDVYIASYTNRTLRKLGEPRAPALETTR